MPRQARKKSETGIYHIMLRGINRQRIFEEKEDKDRFIQVISENKTKSEFKIFAYCLMSNHIHLLIQEVEEPIEQIMKRIATKYVYWYNLKYQRVGHLFQDRFKSEPIETDEYLFTVLRYIHQNPIKAGICKRNEDYKYSSYNEYLGQKNIVDSEFILEMLPIKEFVEFHKEEEQTKCLDISDNPIRSGVTDEQAQKIIMKHTKCKSVSDFQKLDIKSRDKALKLLREKGLSIRQISRLTGVSFNVVRKF